MQERLQSKTAAHTLPSWRARANLRPIAVLQPVFTDLSDTAANKPGNCSIVACLPDFAAYINDDGQGRTAATVSLDIMLTGSSLVPRPTSPPFLYTDVIGRGGRVW